MELRKALAVNIKILMEQVGIHSQAQLAQITGVSQSQIGNILRHEKGTSTDILERLAQGLECEPWVLLASSGISENYNNREFAPMMQCYMRLDEEAQNIVWKIAHDLYESTGKLYEFRG